MFSTLSDRLTATFKNLRGKGRLSEADIAATVKEIRTALLEADVALPVVREFTTKVRERALGDEVSGALNPAQQVVKIVNDELVQVLGGQTRRLRFAKNPPTVISGTPPWTTSSPRRSGDRAREPLCRRRRPSRLRR